jgi:dCTP deaminase
MGVLSGVEIRQRMDLADVENRLVISPLLEIDEQARKDQGSVDLRLGFQFALSAASTAGVVDEFDPDGGEEPRLLWKRLFRQEYRPFGGKIIIHPHQFILASTLEYIRLPKDIMAYVLGRSTWGRLGLIIATALGVQPGFAGCLALELRNLGEVPIALYPGQAMAQLFFHTVEGAQQAGVGQYSGATEILPGNLSSEKTHQKIKSLVLNHSS